MPGPRPDIEWTLRQVFGKASFRPSQREIIVATLNGDDVFVQAATSFGKSLCFQLPAVINLGITIVISPLLSLMKNQISALEGNNIVVAALNSSTPSAKKKEIFEDLACGHPRTRLLYVTPEQVTFDIFRKHIRTVYQQGQLSRIAVDEAHCISEWGHDFRKAFSHLHWFKDEFPDVPIIALTATATARVQQDVISTLRLDQSSLKRFIMTTARPNLHYEIRFKSDFNDPYDDFSNWLKAIYARRRAPARAADLACAKQRPTNVSGIIYTLLRRDCEVLAAKLTQDGIGAKPFHAGLTATEKDDHLRHWVTNEPGYDVIVATTAFGMGIDKDNVRFVVHWQLPKSFEGFYQEAGRAGRDARAAACILYYSREDRDAARVKMQKEVARKMGARFAGAWGQAEALADPDLGGRIRSMEALIRFCEDTRGCRHRSIGAYFDEAAAGARCERACDWCKDAAALVRRKDLGLSSEDYCSTQRQAGAYEVDEYAVDEYT